ncbi:hypothetical protein APE01nite_01500 [Acetobacter peroxydans]|uniref:Uncharacterized protein n=1 Tax=Acetobacter peroxydans TaxID=104098 RepID=A0A4Y3TRI8_9PROT|nr:hypothetical protein AA0475_1120 [Acetobacter peroxydans]GEB84353.1 hypothetical protein APE01nite_01500 [Acetobacter peroxydans]
MPGELVELAFRLQADIARQPADSIFQMPLHIPGDAFDPVFQFLDFVISHDHSPPFSNRLVHGPRIGRDPGFTVV